MTGSPEFLVPLEDWREPAPAPPVDRGRRGLLAGQGAGVLAAGAAALAVLVTCALRDRVSFPYSDAHDWAALVLDTERSGDWLGSLWRPANAQRIPWARLAQALFIETHGRLPAFQLIGAGLWGFGLAALGALLLRRGPDVRLRLWLAGGAALMLACSPLGEDFALPVFSVLPLRRGSGAGGRLPVGAVARAFGVARPVGGDRLRVPSPPAATRPAWRSGPRSSARPWSRARRARRCGC